METKEGMFLKRKNKNYATVEIVQSEPEDDFIIIYDKGTEHCVEKEKLDDYFTVVEPEFLDTVPREPDAHNNIDNSSHHSISGNMNNPSEMQELAFKKQS